MVECLGIPSENLLIKTYIDELNWPLVNYLKKNNYDFFVTNYSDQSIEAIFEFKPDFILSLFARDIIPGPVLLQADLSMNLHPSLLPDYKGCFSVPWVLINGETVTGVTFHEIAPRVDTGLILAAYEEPILTHDTAFSLYARLNGIFVSNFLHVLKNYIAGNLTPIRQEGSTKRYYPRKLPFDGMIDPTWDIKKIHAFIRAMFYPPFDPAGLIFGNKKYFVNSIQEFKEIVE